MKNLTKVLVTDAQMRNSLAVIRSLGSKGLSVTGAEETRFATGFFSKYCNDRIVYPSPYRHPEIFTGYLLDRVRKGNYKAIFPVSDSTIIPIAQNKVEFSKYTLVPVPDYRTLMKAMDKAETIKIAQENGVACPKTYMIDNARELEAAKASLRFPMVIKPRRSSGSRGLTLCQTAEELSSRYPKVVATYGPCIIQEYIPPGGEEVGVYTLLNFNSEPRATVVQKRLRSYPVSGGPSTMRETISRSELVDIAHRLLNALNWSGIAMVEFKYDPRDNQPKLMEINPRWWGSLQLSILAGVDFPYLLYKLVKEGDIPAVPDYKIGVRCRWLLPGDILWLVSAPHKLGNLAKFFKYEPNYDIISRKDPGPTLGFFLASLRFSLDKDMWKFVIRR